MELGEVHINDLSDKERYLILTDFIHQGLVCNNVSDFGNEAYKILLRHKLLGLEGK